jgi:DNA invertase Pin-like site-specific DNA recombinase
MTMEQSALAHAERVLRVVLYIRVSSDEQAGKGRVSLSEQEKQCRIWLKTKFPRYQILSIYEDHISGKRWDRPDFQHMCHAMMQSPCPFDVIVAYNRDRLNRSLALNGYMETLANMAGVHIFIVKEDECTDKKDRGLLEVQSTQSPMPESEAVLITERTQMGRKGRAEQGKLISTSWPKFGWLWGDPSVKHGKSFYVLDPETAPISVHVFTMVTDEVPTRRMCFILDAEGVPSPARVHFERGHYQLTEKRLAHNKEGRLAWTRKAITRMVRDSAYKGEHVIYAAQNEYTTQFDEAQGLWKRTRHITARPENDPLRHVIQVPAIVSAELWARANAVLDRNKENALRSKPPEDDALLARGHAVCEHCKTTMFVARRRPRGQPNGPVHAYYVCRRRKAARDIVGWHCPVNGVYARVEPLDTWAWAEFKSRLKCLERLETLLRRAKGVATGDHTEPINELAVLNTQIANLEARGESLLTQMEYLNESEAREAIGERYETLVAELREAKARQAQTAQAHSERAARLSDLEEAVNWARTLDEHDLNALSFAEKRLLLFAFGVRVMVRRGERSKPHAELTLDWEELENELAHTGSRRGDVNNASTTSESEYS